MKIAIVVQRYGEEINGGAEYFCRKLAEEFAKEDEVDVLTTCALDYMTWADHYEPGVSQLNGVTLRRFRTNSERPVKIFNWVYRISDISFGWKKREKIHTEFSLKNWLFILQNFLRRVWLFFYFDLRLFVIWEKVWMYLQGPRSQGLEEYVRENGSKYDVVLFKTFGYGSTYYNIPEVSDRSVLIPTAHSNELIMKFRLFDKVFQNARCLAFLTPEEQKSVHHRFPDSKIPLQNIVGFGIDQHIVGSAERFRKKFQIEEDFVLYLGRISVAKGCDELFHAFSDLNVGNELGIKLVTIGKSELELPKGDAFVHLGFVSETDKYDALAAAKALIVPSKYESLSIVLLESWLVNTPVLVNGSCDVIVGQCQRSQGGLSYHSHDLKEKLSALLNNPEVSQQMGRNGRQYVLDYYSWPTVLECYRKMFRAIQY